ncbi:DUF1134 domain-containing protein [Sphingomonas sp. RP10(2022)]|uniref:DUF1134 domain-containing protein n=1 Tax=Sphingomonas liriopis TaxID=2949094 RepID=A0A9X2HUV7_9SPHN|nr:DUF1134 domain-containing protein [Sphingomonas liriopis]MCP3734661.1 DUF1134 domain-containing protein [Sphingomonas liriopis]
MRGTGFAAAMAMAAMALGGPLAASAPAQVTTIDPNRAIDGDLSGPASTRPRTTATPRAAAAAPAQTNRITEPAAPSPGFAESPAADASPAQQQARAEATNRAADTYQREDLLAAGEGVFGKGAAGLAGLLEKVLKEQGQPNAYIAGREAAGAFVVGLRYGSGVMSHKVEGQQPVYWTGPSVGFDVGGDANKVFVLVYNLYDSEELFHRFPAAEGRLYLVGGFAATYLRRGNVVLIPIRLGVGYRAGVNVGYMKFTHKAKWLPF